MKKQILACAVAAAFATGAVAADVSIYGTVDTGFNFGYSKVKGEESTKSFKLDSGISGPTRWGIKGGEDLGNGYSVSFDLQSGFDADTGTLGQNGRLFGREARLTVAGPFGELSFGRMGCLTSAAGTYDIFQGYADIYDGGWGTANSAIGVKNFFYSRDRYDNMTTYATPTVAGVKGYAQYSFNLDGQAAEGNERNNTRYAGVGLAYENGPLAVVAVYDTILYKNDATAPKKDARAVSVGGSYDFGVAKVFAAYQYGKNETMIGAEDFDKQLKAHNAHLGVAVPVCAGTLNVGAYYTTAKAVDNSDLKLKVYDVAATYTYPLSKRTSVYAGVGYAQTKNELTAGENTKTKAFDAAIGLAHSF